MTHEHRQAHETGPPSSTRRDARPAIDGAAPRKQSDRATRFLLRLDDHLRTLADDLARRSFLVRQQAGWERRYARFVATDGAAEAVASASDPPQAADFLITITGLAARRIALDERGHTARHAGVAERVARKASRRSLPSSRAHEGVEERSSSRLWMGANAPMEISMSDRHANDRLGGAILSLLVAADQRCPTIIGQAHLLYHARFGRRPENAAISLAELKRAADDLLEAIAAVESAMKEGRQSAFRSD